MPLQLGNAATDTVIADSGKVVLSAQPENNPTVIL